MSEWREDFQSQTIVNHCTLRYWRTERGGSKYLGIWPKALVISCGPAFDILMGKEVHVIGLAPVESVEVESIRGGQSGSSGVTSLGSYGVRLCVWARFPGYPPLSFEEGTGSEDRASVTVDVVGSGTVSFGDLVHLRILHSSPLYRKKRKHRL